MSTVHITLLPDDEKQQLQHIENIIHSLNLERSSILQRQNARQSTINQLPSEILVEIFLAAVDHDPSHDMSLQSGEEPGSVPPLFLGSICKKWRDIAWASPRLWCRIPLVLSRKHYSSQVDILKEWLLRTSQCLLSIVITPGNDGIDTWVESPPVEVISCVTPHSHRWQHFDFFLFTSCHSQLSNICHNLPRLESLAISSSVPFFPAFVWTLFNEVPVLRRVRLSKMAFAHVQLPVAQLTHLIVSDMSVTDCIDILRQCYNLEHCSFLNLLGPHDIDFPAQPVVSRKLETLHIDFSNDIVVVGFLSFLRSISIPAARNITITEIGTPSYLDEAFFVSDAIVKFAFTTRCHIDLLHSLSVQVFDFVEEMFIRLLKGATRLENLKFIKTSGVGRYESSGFNAFNTKILSTLESLDETLSLRHVPGLCSFHYSGPVQFTIEELLACLEVRQKHGCLKDFTIPKSTFWGTYNKTPTLYERFEQLVKGGMDISVVLGGEKWI
ncbi:hypothetical protein BDQ17DRAFT_371990 [Cyathus striatus]|nr:hypothetical protein BDQ17DRAFT_371990 [Cyathus striatus]